MCLNEKLEIKFSKLFQWEDLHGLPDKLALNLAYKLCELVSLLNDLLGEHNQMTSKLVQCKLECDQINKERAAAYKQCDDLKQELKMVTSKTDVIDNLECIYKYRKMKKRPSSAGLKLSTTEKNEKCESVSNSKETSAAVELGKDDATQVYCNAGIKQEPTSPIKAVAETICPSSPILTTNKFKLMKLQGSPVHGFSAKSDSGLSPKTEAHLLHDIKNLVDSSSPSVLKLDAQKLNVKNESRDSAEICNKVETELKENIYGARKRPQRNGKLSCAKRRTLKQSLLSFQTPKQKQPLDISDSEGFCGGTRANSSLLNINDAVDENAQFDAVIQVPSQELLPVKNEIESIVIVDDDNVIAASPVNLMLAPEKPLRQTTKNKLNLVSDRIEKANGADIQTADNDETMVFTMVPSEVVQFRSKPNKLKNVENGIVPVSQDHKIEKFKSTNSERNLMQPADNDETMVYTMGHAEAVKSFSQPSNVENIGNVQKTEQFEPRTLFANSKSLEVFACKEPTVRKVSERKKLPGWSCKNCKDFYEAVYKDNEDMLLEMMNRCSRHRGKFNPEKMETPAGYWELRFSSTEDDFIK